MNNFKQPGDSRTWVNTSGSVVSSGDVVVVGQQLAIASVDIAIGASGAVSFTGEYEVPKVSAAVIVHGETVMLDVSAGAFDDNLATPATGDVSNAAVAAETVGATVTTMRVQLANRIGSVA